MDDDTPTAMAEPSQSDSQSDGNEGRPVCPHCGAVCEFHTDSLGRVHCGETGRVLKASWLEEHPEVDVPEPADPEPEPDVEGGRGMAGEQSTSEPASRSESPMADAGSSLNPLAHVLDLYGLVDHPAGQAALRERKRRGRRLDPADLDQLLQTGDVNAGTRRLAVREYSQIVSSSAVNDLTAPAGGQAESQPESNTNDIQGLVSALSQLDEVRSREASGGDEIAETVVSSLSPVLEQLSETQRALAAAVQSGGEGSSELEELRAEIEALREDERDQRLRELEEKLEDASGVTVGSTQYPESRDAAEVALADRLSARLAERVPPLDVQELREIIGALRFGNAPQGQNAPMAMHRQQQAGSGTPRSYTPEEPADRENTATTTEGEATATDGDADAASVWDSLNGGGEAPEAEEKDGVPLDEALETG